MQEWTSDRHKVLNENGEERKGFYYGVGTGKRKKLGEMCNIS